MQYEWDSAKRSGNISKHGIDFAEIEHFDWTARWLQRNLGLASKDSLHRATYQGDYTWWFMFVEVQIAVSLA